MTPKVVKEIKAGDDIVNLGIVKKVEIYTGEIAIVKLTMAFDFSFSGSCFWYRDNAILWLHDKSL